MLFNHFIILSKSHRSLVFHTPFLQHRDSICQQVVCSFVHYFVHPCILPVTKCTIMCSEEEDGPRSANFRRHGCWKDTFACQFSSKSSTSLTFNFKVKDSNQIHWQVHTWNQHELCVSVRACVRAGVCAWVRACMSACVRVYVFIRLNSTLVVLTKTVWDKSVIFSTLCRPLNRHPVTYLSTFSHDIDLVFEGQILILTNWID